MFYLLKGDYRGLGLSLESLDFKPYLKHPRLQMIPTLGIKSICATYFGLFGCLGLKFLSSNRGTRDTDGRQVQQWYEFSSAVLLCHYAVVQ